jgi:HSP20 family protein
MSFLKKLKKDIGVEEELAEKEAIETQQKEEKEKKAPSFEKKENSSKEKKKSSKEWLKPEGQLAVDVYQTAAEFCVQAPIAGVNPEDIDVSVENEMLIIKGERKEPDAEKEKDYFYQECYWGPFSRQIILPEEVDINKIKASLKRGILTIKIPKISKMKKKKVSIVIGD